MTSCVHSNTQAAYGLCWEWVASLPTDGEAPETGKAAQANDSIIAGSGLISRRHGVLGLANGGKHNASDIYQLAQAARKARERQSIVASSTVNEPPTSENDRTVMLRSAYAAQRHPPSEGTLSLESSFDPFGLLDEDEHFPTAEEMLLELGFGGPAQGIDRVPERFLHPSQMRGVELDKFFTLQQELEEARETGSLGYRGLIGPASRRPSTIVARLMERMLQKSLPTITSSFDVTSKEQQQETVTINSQLMTLPVADSRKTSPASSRRSSLRRQDCFDLEEPVDRPQLSSEPGSQSISEDEEQKEDEAVGSEIVNKQTVEPAFLPTVYVTPPPTAFTKVDSGHEVDSIIACLQLAAEVYRVQLDQSDENHNTADLKQDLRRELDKTDSFLQKLKERLWNARSSREPIDAGSLRSVLNEMIELLQQQQRLYNQAAELVNPENCEDYESEDDSQSVQLPASWARDFERRVSAAVRRSVRRELVKARKSVK